MRKQLARRNRRAHRSRHHDFGDAACSTSPRWMRGGIGFLLGGMLGGMIGGGVALAMFDPTEGLKTFKTTTLVATGLTLAGAVGGLALGASKPEC